MPGGAHDNMRAWTPEEDEIIMSMVAKIGCKWTEIVKHLDDRTLSSVRNRYQRIEKGIKLANDPNAELKNRCHACGELKRGHSCKAKRGGGPQVDLPSLTAKQRQPPPPAVHGGFNFGGLTVPTMMMPGAPNYAPPPGPSYHPSLKRTRSGSRLVPAEPTAQPQQQLPAPAQPQLPVRQNSDSRVHGGAGHTGFSVDVAAAMPGMQRSNTSFFSDLFKSDAFSPTSTEMLKAWADSPHAGLVANDSSAPPSLRRVASGGGLAAGGEAPKMTRAVASYLTSLDQGVGMLNGGVAGLASLTSSVVPSPALLPSGVTTTTTSAWLPPGAVLPGSLPGPFGGAAISRQPSITRSGSFSRGPSGLSRQPSIGVFDGNGASQGSSGSSTMMPPGLGRSDSSFLKNNSFVNGLFDTSATLESAPPANAVPALAAGSSFSNLLADPPGIGRQDSELSVSGRLRSAFGSSPRGSRIGSPRH